MTRHWFAIVRTYLVFGLLCSAVYAALYIAMTWRVS